MSIFKKYIPALINNGIEFTDPIQIPSTVVGQVGSNLSNLVDRNSFASEIKTVLEFDKNHRTPYLFLRKTDNGRIGLYMAVLMKQVSYNRQYTALNSIPVWVITSTSSGEFKRKTVRNEKTVERIAYANANPFYLLHGSNSSQINGATVTGTLSEFVLPTKPAVFNNDFYVNTKGEETDKTIATMLNSTCLRLWKQMNQEVGTFNPEDDEEVDADKLDALWKQYETLVSVATNKGYIASTTAVYAVNNQVHLGNFAFYSGNNYSNQLDARSFIGKQETKVTDLPDNRVVMVVTKQDHTLVESDYEYGLYQLDGIGQQRIVIEDDETASVTPESFTGLATVRDSIGNEVLVDIRVIEQSYGRVNQYINKIARNFSKITVGSEILIIGKLSFYPNGITGKGIRAQLEVENYKFIRGSEKSNDFSANLGSDIDNFDPDILNNIVELEGTVSINQNDDNESNSKTVFVSDEDLNM